MVRNLLLGLIIILIFPTIAIASGFFNPLEQMIEMSPYIGTHIGVDYEASQGDPVYAIANGQVVFYSGTAQGYGGGCGDCGECKDGEVIFIRHQKSDGTYFIVQYGHIQNVPTYLQYSAFPTEFPRDLKGPFVNMGQKIAEIGKFDPCRSGEGCPRCDHLHFGWWDSENPIPSGSWGYGNICYSDPEGCWINPIDAMNNYESYNNIVGYFEAGTDGWHDDGCSQAILDAWLRNGGSDALGYPVSVGGGGVWVHSYSFANIGGQNTTVYLQDYENTTTSDTTTISYVMGSYDAYLLEGCLGYMWWHPVVNINDPDIRYQSVLGAPTSDEIDDTAQFPVQEQTEDFIVMQLFDRGKMFWKDGKVRLKLDEGNCDDDCYNIDICSSGTTLLMSAQSNQTCAELLTNQIGIITIPAGISSWFTLNTTPGTTYTMRWDFSMHSFSPLELVGTRQQYQNEWPGVGVWGYTLAAGASNPVCPFRMPASEITFVAPSDSFRVAVVDIENFSDNTGEVVFSLVEGTSTPQGLQVVIPADQSSWVTLPTIAHGAYIVHMDFSAHSFGAPHEPAGWRQNYQIDWAGMATELYTFESGLPGNIVLQPCSAISFSAPGDWIRVQVFDSYYGDNLGDVVVTLEEVDMPTMPENLSGVPIYSSGELVALFLKWNSISEPDFSHYSLHRDIVEGFVPNSSNLIYETSDTSYYDLQWRWIPHYAYKLCSNNTGGFKSDYVTLDFDEITGDNIPQVPGVFALHQNVPNPFNPSTTIKYHLPEYCSVLLEVFDVSGKRIACLINEFQEKGPYAVNWNGLDQNGNTVNSGIYFYRLKAGKETISKKMVLLR